MSKVRVHEDTKEALDALATRNESYDTIIWKLLADAGHVEHDEDQEDLDELDEEEEEEEEELGLIDRFWGWLQDDEEEELEEE